MNTPTNQTTYRTLMFFDNEIKRLNGSVIFFLLQPKIKQFYKANDGRCDTLNKKMADLLDEYFEMEIDGNGEKSLKMQPPSTIHIEGKEPSTEPTTIMKPGKTMEEYQRVWNEFLDKPCVINM